MKGGGIMSAQLNTFLMDVLFSAWGCVWSVWTFGDLRGWKNTWKMQPVLQQDIWKLRFWNKIFGLLGSRKNFHQMFLLAFYMSSLFSSSEALNGCATYANEIRENSPNMKLFCHHLPYNVVLKSVWLSLFCGTQKKILNKGCFFCFWMKVNGSSVV